ncbi:N-acetylglucosaminidase, partial [Oceanobacillus kimchii]
KTVWLHSAYVGQMNIEYKIYPFTLNQALSAQLDASPPPQTDKNYNTYVSKQYINSRNEVTADKLNVRGGPNTSYWVVGQLNKGSSVKIITEINGWYQIEYTKNRQFVNASPEDVLFYLNPNNFINDDKQKFQFLDLSKPSGSSASTLNEYLRGKGTLSGQGEAFLEAGRKNGISDLYLISHAQLETGNGSSSLAQGIVHNGVKVYNMFGIGANDGEAEKNGAKFAYENGWTSPSKAIIGGAQFIGNNYIKAGQNTLYSMRFNFLIKSGKPEASHQYATDIGWSSKQISNMYSLYQELGIYDLNLEVPVYR